MGVAVGAGAGRDGVPSGEGGCLPELRVVASTGSTNDDLMALGRSGAPAGTAEAAHEQTAGRGRRGHAWGSPSTGLYLSVLLRPDVPMSHYMGLSAVCCLGALDALQGLGATRAELKWPNDIVAPIADEARIGGPDGAASAPGEGGKLCGLLVEAGTGEAGMFAVCGVGVNLVVPKLEGSYGSVRPLAPASLADAMGEAPDGSPLELPGFEELALALRAGIVRRCDEWASAVGAGRAVAGPLAPVLSEYFDRLPALGHEVLVVYPNGRAMARGTFVAVDVWGRATVRLSDGREIEVSSEQASLRAC